MKQASFLQSVIVTLLTTMTILHTTKASAQLYMGKITLEVGEEYLVSAVPINAGYTASGYFTKNGTNFVITATGSYNCKIRANYVGKGTLSYWGSVARSNTWTTDIYDLYWDVEVKAAPVKVTSISLSNSSVSLTVGKEKQLTATVLPSNATNKSVTWSSSDTGVATVDNNGLVTAVAEGTATVICKAKDGSNSQATCVITVSCVQVTDMKINQASASLYVGETIQLSAIVTPSNAANKTMIWESSRNDLVNVNSDGLITAQKVGTAIITCITTDGSDKIDRCIIDVVEKDNWQNVGNYTISWYKKDKSEYIISSNKELAGMAYLINNGYTDFEGKTIVLSNDIDLSGKQWVPGELFKGTFDGAGHIIYGTTIHDNVIIKSIHEPALLGFWKKLDNAKIKRLTLQGNVNLTCTSEEGLDAYVGGMAGQIVGGNSVVENCTCDVNVNLTQLKNSKDDLNSGGIGGFFGKAGSFYGNSGVIRYCTNKGNITCIGGNDKPFYLSLGGIIGYDSANTVIEYCENNASLFSSKSLYPLFSVSPRYAEYYGGIAGQMSAYRTQIRCCRSVLQRVEMDYVYKTAAPPVVSVGGIVGDFLADGREGLACSITNCYSSIGSVNTNSLTGKHLYFGGIASCDDETIKNTPTEKANYSNNDLLIITNLPKTHVIDGYSGFSSEQMQASVFLEELNMYSILEMDGPVWKQDEKGGYPYIAKLYEDVAVNPVLQDKIVGNHYYYSLTGQRLNAPQKGVNIIGGKKVIVK